MEPAIFNRDTADSAPKSAARELCQVAQPRSFSTLLSPRYVTLCRRLVWHLRTNGLLPTIRRAWGLLKRKLQPRLAPPHAALRLSTLQDILDLQPGEVVMVKSEQEILQTLDSEGKYRGLAFLPEMKAYCGHQFTVYKRLERVFLEESKQYRRLKHTVLLSGAVCNGVGIGCDRSCLLYWREIWLRRVESATVAKLSDSLPG